MTEGEREMRPGRFHLVSRGAEHSALLSSIDEDAGPARTGEKGRNLNGATCEPPRELPGGGFLTAVQYQTILYVLCTFPFSVHDAPLQFGITREELSVHNTLDVGDHRSPGTLHIHVSGRTCRVQKKPKRNSKSKLMLNGYVHTRDDESTDGHRLDWRKVGRSLSIGEKQLVLRRGPARWLSATKQLESLCRMFRVGTKRSERKIDIPDHANPRPRSQAYRNASIISSMWYTSVASS